MSNQKTPEVKVGQVWADNDSRAQGRTLRVEAIDGDKAVCIVLTNYAEVQESLDLGKTNLRDARGKKVRIKLSRMRPTSTGYRLVKNVGEPPAQSDQAAGPLELPYGGDVQHLRIQIGTGAALAERRFAELYETMRQHTDRDAQEWRLVHNAAYYGWSLVVVLGWLAERHGPEAAYEAAAIVQDLGENGVLGLETDVREAVNARLQDMDADRKPRPAEKVEG
jgi:hypothetical protein